LTWALVEGEFLASCHGLFTPGKRGNCRKTTLIAVPTSLEKWKCFLFILQETLCFDSLAVTERFVDNRDKTV
jgi:hypothetical protein